MSLHEVMVAILLVIIMAFIAYPKYIAELNKKAIETIKPSYVDDKNSTTTICVEKLLGGV